MIDPNDELHRRIERLTELAYDVERIMYLAWLRSVPSLQCRYTNIIPLEIAPILISHKILPEREAEGKHYTWPDV